MTVTDTSFSTDTPLGRLQRDLAGPSLESAWASLGYSDQPDPVILLETLRDRLADADKTFTGISSAVDRGDIATIIESVQAVDERRRFESRAAEEHRRLAADRLEGARKLHRMYEADHQQAALVPELTERVEYAGRYIRELEATLARVNRNSSRLITVCHARADSAMEPF